jgi:hypothetical protein
MFDDYSLLPQYPAELAHELSPPRRAWKKYYWPGATLVFVIAFQLFHFVLPDLGMASLFSPIIAALVAVYTVGLFALGQIAWYHAKPIDE